MFQPGNTRGDRSALTYDERQLLETKVLPTARRWLDIPGLARHGINALAYWGEAVPQKVGN